MRLPHVLVVSKAPEPGKVKTRLARECGTQAAASVAAASLLDTLAACTEAVGAERRHVSLAGDLDRAVDGDLIRAALVGWTVHRQVGLRFNERLADAHACVPGPVVQIGMDTPHITGALLLAAAQGLRDHDAVVGPAEDGGWWLLALRDPAHAAVLRDVPMSRPTTYDDTVTALRRAGLEVGTTTRMRDVDTVRDADAVAPLARGTRFAEVWADCGPRNGRPAGEVFTRALEGDPCEVVGVGEHPLRLPMRHWTDHADADDLAILTHCQGSTLDIGCGPGRLTEALAGPERVVLGIDVVPAAVRLTHARGVPAVRGDVFEPVPAEGTWQTALLADGNVGIGGDPVALLARVRELVAPGGRIVVELAAPGARLRSVWARLQCRDLRSRRFRWAVVGTDHIRDVALAAGLGVRDLHQHGRRWCAVLSMAALEMEH